MGQQTVVPEIDADHPEQINAREEKHDAGPAEEPGHEHQQRKQVNPDRPGRGNPVNASHASGILLAGKGGNGARCIDLNHILGHDRSNVVGDGEGATANGTVSRQRFHCGSGSFTRNQNT